MRVPVLYLLVFLEGVSAFTATLTSRTRKVASASIPSRPSTHLFSGNENDAASEEARILLEKARKAREEAETMERDLVASKLRTLESLLERQSQLSKADETDIQDRIDRLKNYNNKSATTSPEVKSKASSDETNLDGASPTPEEMDRFAEEEPREVVKELSPEDKKALEQVQAIFLDFKDILNSTLISDEVDEEFWMEVNGLEVDLNNTLMGDITQEELEVLLSAQKAISGIASFLGLNTSVWEDIKEGLKEQTMEFKSELEKDPMYLQRLQDLGRYVPEQILVAGERLNETDIEEFVERVMLPIDSIFQLSSMKGKKVGGAYLLQGTPKVRDGDKIVDRIEKQLLETGLQGRFEYYYIRDVTPIVDLDEVAIADELQQGIEEVNIASLLEAVDNLAKPAILVTSSNVDLSPQTPPEARAPWLALGVVSTAAFAVSCYEQDMELTQQLVVGFTSPIFFGVLGIQLLHELGHLLAATVHKIEIAYPVSVVPSPSTGLVHVNTQLKSPPKNNNALFDFAILGPILGLAAAWTTLLVGLQLTSAVKSSEIASLPHLPFEFFQVSTLTSATIESFLGTDVLLSLDSVSDKVAVHPLVIAGHVGILLNALNLLPTRQTTDGGRMLTAVNDRTGILVETMPPVMGLFLLVQGFRSFDACNLLILYLLLIPLVQPPVEVPCKNDVDKAGGVRLPVFAATTILALIALSPAF